MSDAARGANRTFVKRGLVLLRVSPSATFSHFQLQPSFRQSVGPCRHRFLGGVCLKNCGWLTKRTDRTISFSPTSAAACRRRCKSIVAALLPSLSAAATSLSVACSLCARGRLDEFLKGNDLIEGISDDGNEDALFIGMFRLISCWRKAATRAMA